MIKQEITKQIEAINNQIEQLYDKKNQLKKLLAEKN